MGTYGRNFSFRVTPKNENRGGRFAVPSTGNRLPIGVPVVADTSAGVTSLTAYPTQNVQTLKLATGAQAPVAGQSGILVYEYGPAAFAGFDPLLTLYSDLDTVPLGANVQLVNGPNVKVLFKNTAASTFLHVRNYAARTMVAGLTAVTPSVSVGSFLTPGTGDDVNGYWQTTATQSQAWMVVTSVDSNRLECEAHLLF
jgi:hypothetical protein